MRSLLRIGRILSPPSEAIVGHIWSYPNNPNKNAPRTKFRIVQVLEGYHIICLLLDGRYAGTQDVIFNKTPWSQTIVRNSLIFEGEE